MQVATRISGKKFTATDLTLNVASGSPVHVYGIEFSNVSGAARLFTINEADGTFIFELSIANLGYQEWSVPFIADKGLQIVCSVGGVATAVVLHNNPGR